jgi:hypothetical protein
VRSFEMYEVTRDDGAPPYSIVEVYEFEREEDFGSDPSPSPTAADWERFADPDSVRNVFCRRI